MKKNAAWLPKKRAKRRLSGGFGSYSGKGKRALVIHTSESGTGGNSIDGVASWVIGKRSQYHLLIDDKAKRAIQLGPFNKSARAMLHGYGQYGCNQEGEVVIQVCILGHDSDQPYNHLSPWAKKLLRDICKAWGIPIRVTRDNSRSMKSWRRSGITTHSSAPGNDHGDGKHLRKNFLRRKKR